MTFDAYQFERIVKHYHKPDYKQITDYTKVVENKTTTVVDGETIYVFEAPGQTIYLNEEGYPITIGKQMSDAENNQYLYKWYNTPDATYYYVAPYEWKRTSLPHLEIDEEED